MRNFAATDFTGLEICSSASVIIYIDLLRQQRSSSAQCRAVSFQSSQSK